MFSRMSMFWPAVQGKMNWSRVCCHAGILFVARDPVCWQNSRDCLGHVACLATFKDWPFFLQTCLDLVLRWRCVRGQKEIKKRIKIFCLNSAWRLPLEVRPRSHVESYRFRLPKISASENSFLNVLKKMAATQINVWSGNTPQNTEDTKSTPEDAHNKGCDIVLILLSIVTAYLFLVRPELQKTKFENLLCIM